MVFVFIFCNALFCDFMKLFHEIFYIAEGLNGVCDDLDMQFA